MPVPNLNGSLYDVIKAGLLRRGCPLYSFTVVSITINGVEVTVNDPLYHGIITTALAEVMENRDLDYKVV